MKTENQKNHRGVRSVSGQMHTLVEVCCETVLTKLQTLRSITCAIKASSTQWYEPAIRSLVWLRFLWTNTWRVVCRWVILDALSSNISQHINPHSAPFIETLPRISLANILFRDPVISQGTCCTGRCDFGAVHAAMRLVDVLSAVQHVHYSSPFEQKPP